MTDQIQRMRFQAETESGKADIAANSIHVVLPNGLSFEILSRPGRDGSAVFQIMGAGPDDPLFFGFNIEPADFNLFTVNVLAHRKRPEGVG
jgi:hypothetical protein